MTFTITRRVLAGAALLAIAGCGSDALSTSSAGAGSTSSTGSGPSSPAPASNVTVASATVSGHGAVLVAGSNHRTLYEFDKDTPGNGTSACVGGCLTTWPALTVAAGTSPTAASGISGKWGTITRSDGKGIQVTYNGLPLYLYSGDTKPGDANGDYPHWASVPAAVGAAASAPTATPPGNGSSSSNPYGY
ncbi:MAG: COG4315 family predicted lipoprotein [Candidatus Dormibacteria bacterium]